MLREFFVLRVNSSGPMTDEELLTAILNWHPEDDTSGLLSRAYNRISEMHNALQRIEAVSPGAEVRFAKEIAREALQ